MYFSLLGVGLGLLLFLAYLGVPILPMLVIVGIGIAIWYFSGTGTKAGSLWKKENAKDQRNTIPRIQFTDIGGQERAKKELMEALDFLIQQDKMQAYGIQPLKGILLTGPPGTGKTLMAKAAAHYSDAVFLTASGSEFVEMYVGVGANRVRQLFTQARNTAKKQKKNRAVIFIDEIDVIGAKREGSQHKEYDQTLNQLLTEMDGIKKNDIAVFVIAATNRKDLLDAALTRPGRFDRHISVDLPDKEGRAHILSLHMKKRPIHENVNVNKIAQETYGFSGASLASVVNEAAIYAMRSESKDIRDQHFAQAVDKVLMGEQTDRSTSLEDKKRVAIHELGHALVAELLEPNTVAQVVLTPRGQALGYVRHHPKDDRYLHTKEQLEKQVMICLAGTAAEEVWYDNRSTGAKNDYEQAIQLCKTMIDTGLTSLGIIDMTLLSTDQLSKEVSRILDKLYQQTIQMTKKHHSFFRDCLNTLLVEERLDGDQFRKLLMQQLVS
ncbi:AAA family ATPase [Shimazuella kribbensis]|uniref:AAA family ATPase n=1 Tax=Shimazuella kribbensis TaxID=139808 RepID=UPI0003FD0EA5|nr:AAA family ATPase [Shimazuella kribbensis]